MVAEGNDARMLSFPGGGHKDPEHQYAWKAGCLGLSEACTLTCASSFENCVADAARSFDDCETNIADLDGCTSSCSLTLAMLSLSEKPTVALSEGKFGTRTDEAKHVGDAPLPACVSASKFGKRGVGSVDGGNMESTDIAGIPAYSGETTKDAGSCAADVTDECSGKACGEVCGSSDGEGGDDGCELFCQADATCGWPEPTVTACTPSTAMNNSNSNSNSNQQQPNTNTNTSVTDNEQPPSIKVALQRAVASILSGAGIEEAAISAMSAAIDDTDASVLAEFMTPAGTPDMAKILGHEGVAEALADAGTSSQAVSAALALAPKTSASAISPALASAILVVAATASVWM